jgi:hypothetical protein
VRFVVLTVALAFTIFLGVLTAMDFVNYGVTALGVLAALIVVLFTVGILGAMRQPPSQ